MRVTGFILALLFLTIGNAHAQVDEPVPTPSVPVPVQEPTGKHCLKEQKSKWVVHQYLGVQHNPTGAEHHMRLGLCIPLITTPGILFDLTNIEFGAITYFTPAYFQGGGYAQITPLSLLVLRAEVMGVVYWPLGLDRTGYYSVPDYDADLRPEAFPADDGEVASGFNISLVAILRMKVPLGPVSILGLSQFGAEYYDIGDGGHSVNIRRDLINDEGDWVLTNEGILGVEIPLPMETLLRIAVYDTWRTVPESEYVGNHVGGLVMVAWDRVGEQIHDLQVFVRAGGYTHHAFRTGEFYVAGVALMSYDIGEL